MAVVFEPFMTKRPWPLLVTFDTAPLLTKKPLMTMSPLPLIVKTREVPSPKAIEAFRVMSPLDELVQVTLPAPPPPTVPAEPVNVAP